jgi:hypothetical protein
MRMRVDETWRNQTIASINHTVRMDISGIISVPDGDDPIAANEYVSAFDDAIAVERQDHRVSN